jgi:transposase-like protein
MLEREREWDEEVRKFQAELRQVEMPVIHALAKVGIEINRLWGLLSIEEPYPEAIPILLEYIQNPDLLREDGLPPVKPGMTPRRSQVLETIGRALAVPETRPLWPTLVKLYKDAREPGAKKGLAHALREHGVKDRQLVDEVIQLIKDPRNGESRLALVDVLTQSRQPHAKEVLYELRDDPDLYKEIAVRIKRFERNAKRRKNKS